MHLVAYELQNVKLPLTAGVGVGVENMFALRNARPALKCFKTAVYAG